MFQLEINCNPSKRQLRQFGLACAAALPLMGWLWGFSGPSIAGLAVAGGAAASAAWLAPRLIRPAFLGLSVVTAPVGIVIGEATLLILYFGVFLPVGLLLRRVRGDPLERDFDPESPTYWRSVTPRETASYFRQS
jgi:hypothetical protein